MRMSQPQGSAVSTVILTYCAGLSNKLVLVEWLNEPAVSKSQLLERIFISHRLVVRFKKENPLKYLAQGLALSGPIVVGC